ncbi:MAG: DNA repair protein RecN, partial [Moorea sp. SIO2B7]|nr:DNA repair protein RecN [Moorena sp. SIO2B7]
QVVASAYSEYQEAEKALENRRQSEQKRLQRLDLIEYQIKELKAAELVDGEELEQLQQERDRLSHVVELKQLGYQVYQLLYQNDTGESAGTDLLGQAESILREMVTYDAQLESVLEMVRAAINQVVEAGYQINAYGDGLETDPERLGEVEARINLLKQICRKYGPSLPEVIAYYQKLQLELEELTDSGQSLEELEQNYQKCQGNLTKVNQELTQLRKKAAVQLEKKLVEELKPLAMDKVIFECRLSPTVVSAGGADQVTYYFSPNPGEKVQPLSSIASGGEMSRFLLALKACFANSDYSLGTLIFDEIDAGVSGKVAQAIAAKIHQLSQRQQVLCVTHQPLIAAMADVHFRVDKEIIDKSSLLTNDDDNLNLPVLETPEIRTVVRVRVLDNHLTRREELAQLTGGNAAQDAIAFADSLLAQAASKKAQV